MMTKAQKVAVIWADWNERKITGNEAIYKIGKLFPRVTLKEWRKRTEKTEFSVMEVKA